MKVTDSTQRTNTINSITGIHSFYLRISMVLLGILLAVLFLYSSAVKDLLTAVIHREGSSHGIFVPFLSGFFLWTKRDTIPKIELRYDYLGIPLLLFGIIFPLFKIGPYQIQFPSFIVLTVGLIITLLGRKLLKDILFPILFLITMIPIPNDIYTALANILRDITLGAASWVIALLGIPFFKEGITIHLPNTPLVVDIGCSGIRYLISYFVFGLAYAYLFRKTAWHRFIIVISTIPISLIASILRLTAIFILTYLFGPRMSEYWPHVFISWSVFFTILILSLAADRFLQRRHSPTLIAT